MKIEAVILDFDGTIVDSEPIWQEVQSRLFSDIGYVITPDIQGQTVGTGIDACMDFWFETFQIVNINKETFKQKILSECYKEIIEHAPMKSGFYELIDSVKSNNLPLAICTSSEMEMLMPTLERLDITDLFDIIHSAHGSKFMKPHPDPYLQVAKKLIKEIHTCIVVEDSIPGITAGVASGAKTFGIPSSYDLEKAKTLGATIVDDLSVVANYIKEKV
jgi:HAD superfamily hydrolase (TIGR01509 family)